MEQRPTCYLSVRIKNRSLAEETQKSLEEKGVRVLNPCFITPSNLPNKNLPKEIAERCYQMIDQSSCTVLLSKNGSDFGRDCAAELGYTLASNKPVYIYISEGEVSRDAMKKAMPIHHNDFPDKAFIGSIEKLASYIKEEIN